MNRKERRRREKIRRKTGGPKPETLPYLEQANTYLQSGRLEEAAAQYSRVLELDPEYAPAHNDLAIVLKEQGRLEEALASYQKALELKPDYALAYNNLGNLYKELGRLDDAAASYRRASTLQPDLADPYHNLGLVLLESGQGAEALGCFSHAVNLEPGKAMFWVSYASFLNIHSFASWDDGVGRDLLRILDRPTVIPKRIAASIASTLHYHPVFMTVMALADSTGFEDKADEAAALLSDIPLLLKIMKLCTVNDIGLERMLTRLRRGLLLGVTGGEEITAGLPFQAALALYCFTNEYVFDETPEERDEIEALGQKAAEALEKGGDVSPVWIAVLGSYRELLDFPFAEKLPEREWPEDIRAVVIRQVKEPLEERALKPQIPCLTPIQNKVSQAVRGQYEDNPYPRWVTSTTFDKPRTVGEIFQDLRLPLDWDSYQAPERPEILIAGCGTGHQSLLSASRYANSAMLAVDLSLSSLAYALRKTRELGVSNIEYVQGDILELGNLNRTFDIIECRGVLHHLEDPLVGWRVLAGLLRPGGMMKIGLYSAIARRGHAEAWRIIEENGYSASREDIRRFRQYVMAMPPDCGSDIVNNLKSVDFFSTSDCRDLYFHFQEHHFTLPEIETALRDLGLTFLGFEHADARTPTRFRQQNPEPEALTSLASWHRFEQEHPGTFASMYEFWTRK